MKDQVWVSSRATQMVEGSNQPLREAKIELKGTREKEMTILKTRSKTVLCGELGNLIVPVDARAAYLARGAAFGLKISNVMTSWQY